MSNIEITNTHKIIKIKKGFIKKMISEILNIIFDNKTRNLELSILFTDDKYITGLNKKYFKRNIPTDVIAFPQHFKNQPCIFPSLLGDVVVSLDTAKKQSEQYNVSFEYEILNLITHGILHLIGYRDDSSFSKRKMINRQKEILDIIYGQK